MTTTFDAASGSLSQALVMSLVIERSIQVVAFIFSPQSSSTDPIPPWGKFQVIGAFFIALASLYVTDFDILARILAPEPNHSDMQPLFGFFIGAAMISGGSAGIRQIMNTIKISLISSREVSKKIILSKIEER